MSTKERQFICPKCGSKELVLVREEKVTRAMYQVKIRNRLEWEHGKEEVLDCAMSSTQCLNGHALVLKDGTFVQDDLEALEQWFREHE